MPELADWCVIELVGEGRPPRRVATAHADQVELLYAFLRGVRALGGRLGATPAIALTVYAHHDDEPRRP